MWNIVRKACKNRKEVYRFSLNCVTNIQNIVNALKNRTYKPLSFRLFLIFEPKERLVMSQCITDKIVNHFVTNFYLLPYLENKLIDSNVATRKNKGSRYANELIEKFINTIRIKEPSKDIYALKMDIKKYFYNIDHNILINKLENDIKDKNVINLIKIIIGETNKEYINYTIDRLNKDNNTSIPHYENNVGLSIWAMTSQFLAIYFLTNLDHFIKEQLKCKYYRSLGSYYGYIKKINKKIEKTFKIKLNDKYDYYKNSNRDRIVFIKDKKMYYTKYIDDYLCISFLDSMCVFDTLKKMGVKYLIINENTIYIS